MKTFKNFLNELFTKPSKFTKKVDKKNNEPISYYYKSTINGKELIVGVLRINEKDYKNSWELYFSVDDDTDITGEGDELDIFSTVLSIIEDFIKTEKPDIIEFSVDPNEETRVSLYDRMVKRFSLKVGYRAKEETGLYTLIKKGRS